MVDVSRVQDVGTQVKWKQDKVIYIAHFINKGNLKCLTSLRNRITLKLGPPSNGMFQL